MSDYAPICLPQVLKDEYTSFHGGPFPGEYLTWHFYKDHIAEPARFALELFSIGGEDAPDSFEVRFKRNIEEIAPGELKEYIIRARQQSLDCMVKDYEDLD